MKKTVTIRKQSREEVIHALGKDLNTWNTFQNFTREQQEELILFCMGKRSLRITYDAVFQMLMNPDVHPERIEDLISAILGEKVKIKRVLQREGIRLTDDSSLVIMDVVVELEDKSLVSVEMQRAGYKFPIERADCYGSDLLLRRYNDMKAEINQHNAEVQAYNKAYPAKEKRSRKYFDFSDLSKAIIIVIMENSPALFCAEPLQAFHHRYSVFDTGIPGQGLREDYYLCLDNYRECMHTEIKNKREAWMLFLSSVDLKDMQKVCDAYPEFISLYQEVFDLTHRPKELIQMSSEALYYLSLEEEKVVLQDLYDDLRKAKAESAQVKEEYEQAKAESAQVKEEYEQAKAESAQVKEEIQQAKAESARVKEEIQQAKAESAQMKEEYEQAKAESAQVKEEIQQAKAESARAKEEIQQAKAESARAKEEIQQAKAESAQMKEEYEQVKAESARAKEEIQQAKAESAQMKEEIQQAKAESAQMKKKYEQAEAERQQQKLEIERLKAELQARNSD